jgi:SAM-dependent methyltransferase
MDRRKGLAGTWDLFECAACHSIMLLPLPSAEQLNACYVEYSRGDTIAFSPSRGSRHPALRKAFHWLSGDVDPRDFIRPTSGQRILDYGCGQAGYLVDFHAQGLAVSGAEMSATVVQACREHGLDVRLVTDPDKIPFPDAAFDIVYLMQVFEHVRRPQHFMEELARVVKPGGVLYLAVPNSRSIWRRVFGARWISGWFAPFHLFHYDRHSLSALAAQHGFEMVESWSRTPASWFRLNMKAWLYPRENRLDEFRCVLDAAPLRYLAMIVLHALELFVRERDCLVVKFARQEEEDGA